MSTISIAMATYNGAEYLDQQLESIASQRLPPDELVVSDDCSTDRTLKMIERFARNAPFPVRIFRNQENAGFNRNFARAIAKTSGDVVFLADQDDIWFPGKIDRIAAEFDRSAQLLAVIHDERIIDEATGEFLDCTYFANERALGFGNRELVSGNCTALRRELIEILLPFPDDINYDYWIGWMADVLNCRLILDEPLQVYRRHAGNATDMLLAAEQPSPLSHLLRSGFRDSRPAWRETATQYRLVTERIEQRSPLIDRCLGAGRAASSIERLSPEIECLERRIEVMSLPSLRRRVEVLRNWSSGFYRHFSGAKAQSGTCFNPDAQIVIRAANRIADQPVVPAVAVLPITRAGFPATILNGGTSRVTTAPAPTMQFDPTFTPPRMIAAAPIQHPSPIEIGASMWSSLLGSFAFLGSSVAAISMHLAERMTLSPIRIPLSPFRKAP